jgi:hypothetical protein
MRSRSANLTVMGQGPDLSSLVLLPVTGRYIAGLNFGHILILCDTGAFERAVMLYRPVRFWPLAE